jgi:putative ABC transport system ATP-binding protein
VNHTTSLLTLRVRKSYTLGSDTIHALRGIDLDIARGEIAAITGPSGSGKSTLLNLCGLLDSADAGEVRYDGAAIAAGNEQNARAAPPDHRLCVPEL